MLAALWWWAAAQVIALCAAPLAVRLFRPLADRGYGLSKAFGLLLFGYLGWLLPVLHLLPNYRLTLILLLVGIAAGAGWVWRRDGPALVALWLQRRRLLLLEEGIFLASYLGFLGIRIYNPNIEGTEKFMDFAFLNAITRSTYFPPLDPWLAPSPSVPNPTINYYYFGYLIQGLLLELTQVPPAWGYNLALALLFALAAAGSFSLGYSLTRDIWAELPRPRVVAKRGAPAGGGAPAPPTVEAPAAPAARAGAGSDAEARPLPVWSLRSGWPFVGAGLLAVYLLLIAGNLWTALRRFDGSGLWEKDFWTGIGWNATRVLVIRQGNQELDYTINEFPAFSFLLGDLHPHVLALPFTLVAIGLAYAWLMRPPRLYRWALAGEPLWPAERQPAPSREGRGAKGEGLRLPAFVHRLAPFAELLPGALILGSLYFLNSWDFPAYFALAQAAAIAGAWWIWRRASPVARGTDGAGAAGVAENEPASAPYPSWTRTAGAVLLAGALAVLLFAPFHLTFKPPVVSDGGGLPLGLVAIRSRLDQFLQFWGVQLLLLAPIVFVAAGGLPVLRGAVRASVTGARATAIVARPVAGWELAALAGGAIVLLWLAERAGSGTLLLCLLLAALAGAGARRALEPGSRLGGRPLAFALGALCLALALLAACEVVYIRDFYGGALRRMNTVFKLYYQAWILMAVAGSAATCWLLRRLWLQRHQPAGRRALRAFAATCVLLLGATTFFPYKVTLLRTNAFQNPPTLDGMDWMRRYHPDDYAAAQWLRQHGATPARPAPVVLEATGGAYSEFSRLATQTGFPTILGWDQHERLWRGTAINAEVETRKQDVDAIYTAATFEQARPLLDKYNVSYIVVGYLEHQKYGGANPDEQRRFVERFDALAAAGGLQVAFRQGQTTIYRTGR
jgi:YYY domain-containing protein